MKYIKIKATKYYSNQNKITLSITNETKTHSFNLIININYPLEIINGISDEIIIPVHNNGLISIAYIKRKIFKEETGKEELIKEYLDTPNIFLFKGVNYLKIIL